MTREEAKEIMLKLLSEITKDFDVLEDDEREAFNMAIKALERERYIEEAQRGNRPCKRCKHFIAKKYARSTQYSCDAYCVDFSSFEPIESEDKE